MPGVARTIRGRAGGRHPCFYPLPGEVQGTPPLKRDFNRFYCGCKSGAEMSGWIDLCRTGTWVAKSGCQVTFTAGDLDAIVEGYDPKKREAPLVFGHPKDDAPAYGWVEALRRNGDVLQGKFTQVADGVKELVAQGRYKKISIALFPDGKTLRHVGLLGAAAPAVSGLRSVKFEAEECDAKVFEFSEEDFGDKGDEMTVEKLQRQLEEEKRKREAMEAEASQAKEEAKRQAAELSAYQAKQREKEIEGRIEKLIEGNRILPTDRALVKTLALSLGSAGGEIELSEGSGKKPPVEHFFDLLSGMPDRKLTTEFAAPDGGEDKDKLVDLTKCV